MLPEKTVSKQLPVRSVMPFQKPVMNMAVEGGARTLLLSVAMSFQPWVTHQFQAKDLLWFCSDWDFVKPFWINCLADSRLIRLSCGTQAAPTTWHERAGSLGLCSPLCRMGRRLLDLESRRSWAWLTPSPPSSPCARVSPAGSLILPRPLNLCVPALGVPFFPPRP